MLEATLTAQESMEKLLESWDVECLSFVSVGCRCVYAGRVSRFVDWAEITDPRQITRRMVQRYFGTLLGEGKSPGTIKGTKSAISSFCRWLVLEKLLDEDPTVGTRRPSIQQLPPRYLSDAEIETCLAVASEHGFRLMVLAALKTGMRLNEMRLLQWQDVDLGRDLICVRVSKTGKARFIPIHPELKVALLEAQRESGYVFPKPAPPAHHRKKDARPDYTQPASKRYYHDLIQPLRDAVPAFTSAVGHKSVGRGWHLFRHTFASRLVMAGVSIFKVSKWLGHSQVQMTTVYAHLAPDFDEGILSA